MPYKKVVPASEEEMIDSDMIPIDIGTMRKKRYEGHNTICQKIREVYALTDNEEIKFRCRIMLNMAKKMHEKLKKYRDEAILREINNDN